jgi:hypothetical protein
LVTAADSECSPGATELGSCLTDATHRGRARRTVRVVAAMLRTERATQQSSRPFDSVESFRPPCQKGYVEILAQEIRLSSDQSGSTLMRPGANRHRNLKLLVSNPERTARRFFRHCSTNSRSLHSAADPDRVRRRALERIRPGFRDHCASHAKRPKRSRHVPSVAACAHRSTYPSQFGHRPQLRVTTVAV